MTSSARAGEEFPDGGTDQDQRGGPGGARPRQRCGAVGGAGGAGGGAGSVGLTGGEGVARRRGGGAGRAGRDGGQLPGEGGRCPALASRLATAAASKQRGGRCGTA